MADALSLLQQLLAGQSAYRPEDQGDYLRRYPAGMEPAARGAPPANLFDLAGGSSGRLNQPNTPLNLMPVPSPADWPLELTGGGYSMGRRAGKTSEPLNLQLQYNLPGLPIDLSGGYTMPMGRGSGSGNFMARYRVPF
jgi:hypothetical protein